MLKTTAIGYLGQDCVIKHMENGKSVVNFSIAHTERYKDKKGNSCERTTWVECGAWNKENLAPYLKKGTQVYVEGAPLPNAWVDKDGELKTSLRLNVFSIQLLGKKESSNNATEAIQQEQAAALAEGGTPAVTDDIPF